MGTIERKERIVQRNCLGQVGRGRCHLVMGRRKPEDKSVHPTAPGCH